MIDINAIKDETEKRMRKSIETLQQELSKIRTGRAHPSFLDPVQVEYYGNIVPINQIAQVTLQDSRTLLVTPWEKSSVPAVEKAILNANLGLNPATSGSSIRVPMPALSQERRKDLIRIVRAEAEQARVAIRNIRRDANNKLKEKVKDKVISDDDERRGVDLIQKLTDKFIIEVDTILGGKEKDLLEI